MKWYSALSAIREVQIKTRMKDYYTPVGMIKIKNNDNINAGEEAEKLDHSYTTGRTVK